MHQSHTDSPLLSLPAELTRNIYNHFFDDAFEQHEGRSGQNKGLLPIRPALFTVCRQIRAEVRRVHHERVKQEFQAARRRLEAHECQHRCRNMNQYSTPIQDSH